MTDFKTVLHQILGERIKCKRQELGLSQEFVAKKIQLGRTSVSNIESGKHQINLSTLYTISKVLETDIQLMLPTISEIESKIKSSNIDDIEEYFEKENLNPSQREDIKNILNNLD